MLYSPAANPNIPLRVGFKPVKKVDNTNRYLVKMHCKEETMSRNKRVNTYPISGNFKHLIQTPRQKYSKSAWRV